MKSVVEKLDAGLSVRLCGLPGWGMTRMIRELEIKGRKLVKRDANLVPFKLLEMSEVDRKKPTTVVIDHFESLLKMAEPKVFNHLRAIRDERKYHVTYLVVTSTRCDLSREAERMGNFYELVTESKLYFPVCRREETDAVIDNVARRLGMKVNKEEREEIYLFSGGIPGLVKSWLVEGREEVESSARLRGMLKMIWRGLNEEQRKQLVEFVRDGVEVMNKGLWGWGVVKEILRRPKTSHRFRSAQDDKADLRSLSALSNGEQKCVIGSEAVERFVRDRAETWTEGEGKETSEAQIGEAKVENRLTQIEYRLWKCLKDRAGGVCEREELVEAGWPGDNPEGVSEEAVDQAISRLRKKLLGSGYDLRTVRGRGYLLEISNSKNQK